MEKSYLETRFDSKE